MVNVPALTPYDTFRAPSPVRDMYFEEHKSNKQQSLKGLKPAKANYVDVMVPQTPAKAVFAEPAPRRASSDAIVPEFKTPSAAAMGHKVQLTPPAPSMPQLDFLDMDDWTSPFDLDLDFDSIMYEWDDSVFSSMAAPAPREYGACSPVRSDVSERSYSESAGGVDASAAAVVEAAASVPEQKEEDEFTRNRRLCLERYREKKRNRKFSKKVRYHLRKMNADRRPRYKGRFIKKGEVIPKELLDKPTSA